MARVLGGIVRGGTYYRWRCDEHKLSPAVGSRGDRFDLRRVGCDSSFTVGDGFIWDTECAEQPCGMVEPTDSGRAVGRLMVVCVCPYGDSTQYSS